MNTNRRSSAFFRQVLFAALLTAFWAIPASSAVHVWEKVELNFTSTASFANPYTDVVVWVDLSGLQFKKRVYGFWDGGRTFRVRLVPTRPGHWDWSSGSSPQDTGLAGKTGSFTAEEWNDTEEQVNPLRRGCRGICLAGDVYSQ